MTYQSTLRETWRVCFIKKSFVYSSKLGISYQRFSSYIQRQEGTQTHTHRHTQTHTQTHKNRNTETHWKTHTRQKSAKERLRDVDSRLRRTCPDMPWKHKPWQPHDNGDNELTGENNKFLIRDWARDQQSLKRINEGKKILAFLTRKNLPDIRS